MLIIDRARHARLNRVREKVLQLIAKEEALPLPHEFQPFAPEAETFVLIAAALVQESPDATALPAL